MGLPPAVVATALGPSGSRTQQCRRPGNATGASHRKPENGNEARTARRHSAKSVTRVGEKAERPARARPTGSVTGAVPMTPKRQGGTRGRRDQARSASRAESAARKARPARRQRTGVAIGVGPAKCASDLRQRKTPTKNACEKRQRKASAKSASEKRQRQQRQRQQRQRQHQTLTHVGT